MPFLTTVLIWADEDPTLLYEAVKSWGTVADGLVAVDGAYMLFEGYPRSPAEQADAIVGAARERDMDLILHQPNERWDGEVAKRAFATSLALPRSEWVLFVDADELVTRGERGPVAELLRGTDAPAVDVEFHTLANGDRPATNPFEIPGETVQIPRLYRSQPTLTFTRGHSSITALDRNLKPVPVVRWIDRRTVPEVPLADLRIEHRGLLRSGSRNERRERYYFMRSIDIFHRGGHER